MMRGMMAKMPSLEPCLGLARLKLVDESVEST